jgi:predicted nucleotide-binding protein
MTKAKSATVFLDETRITCVESRCTLPDEAWTTMDKAEISEKLEFSGLHVVNECRNGNDNGWRLEISCGAIINLYDTGKVTLQGKNQEPVRAALDLASPPVKSVTGIVAQPATSRKVFVVYGHDGPARTEVEAMLRRWDLEPQILDQLPSGGQTIIEKLESARRDAVFAVVIATPDDEGHEKDHPDKKLYRARQNVVLELGMMLAVLGRPKVAILMKSDLKMEKPSDIQGLIYIPWKENIIETKLTLAQEMHSQGIKIDLAKV